MKLKASGTGLSVLLLLACLACGGLLAIRVASAATLDRPFLGQTSGLEEEALFSLWKAHHGQPVYTDALAAPFSTSYFNVLFYAAYAAWSKGWSMVHPLADAWLPTVWRFLSLFLCLGTWLVLWRVMCRLSGAALERSSSWFALGAASVCVLNPLFHWMSFSVRPDLAAVLGEVACLGFLLAHVRCPSLGCVVLAGTAAAFAWSFKQSQGFACAGGCVFLAWHRRWRELALFVLPLLIVVPATLGFAGEWYRQNTLALHALASRFDPGQGIRFAASAMAKAPCMLAGLLLLLPLARRWRTLGMELRLICFVTAVSLPLCLFTSSKIGAADYYYLAPSVFASLLLFAVLGSSQMGGGITRWLAMGGLTLQLLSVALIFAGKLGKVSVREDQALAVRLQQRLQHEPGPVLITGRPYNLPWLHAGRPAFVFSYLYDEYERHHPVLQEQGLRALIRQGYFRVVVDVDDPPLDFSPELARSCTLTETGEGYRLYRPGHP